MIPDDLIDLIYSVIVRERGREGSQYELDDYDLATAIANATQIRERGIDKDGKE